MISSAETKLTNWITFKREWITCYRDLLWGPLYKCKKKTKIGDFSKEINRLTNCILRTRKLSDIERIDLLCQVRRIMKEIGEEDGLATFDLISWELANKYKPVETTSFAGYMKLKFRWKVVDYIRGLISRDLHPVSGIHSPAEPSIDRTSLQIANSWQVPLSLGAKTIIIDRYLNGETNSALADRWLMPRIKLAEATNKWLKTDFSKKIGAA